MTSGMIGSFPHGNNTESQHFLRYGYVSNYMSISADLLDWRYGHSDLLFRNVSGQYSCPRAKKASLYDVCC